MQASVSTVLAVLAGIPAGFLLVIYGGRGKNTIISLLLVTYVMPGIIMALGIISLFGYSSRFWEIIYGNIAYNAPLIAVLSFATGSSTSLPEVYSAKILGATDGEILRRFYLKNLLRGGLLGALMTFILSFEGFSLPLIIGGPSYSTIEVLIYQFKSVFPSLTDFPFSNASFLGVIQVITLLIPLYLYVSVRSNALRSSSSFQNPFFRYRKKSFIPLILFTVLVYAPLLFMFVKYPPWGIDYSRIAAKLGISISMIIANTIYFSFASTFISFLISIFLSLYRQGRMGNTFLLLPLILSPVTLALSFFLVYGTYIPTSLLVIIIFSIIVLPLSFRMITQSLDTVPPSEGNSSRILGDGRVSSLFRIQLPRIGGEISTVLSIAFITVMGQFASIVTVYTRSAQTITIGIYRLLQLRDITSAYGLTEIFLVVIFISSYIINTMGRARSGIGSEA